MGRPREWFGYSVACYGVSAALYLYDFALMRTRRPQFDRHDAGRRLYADMLRQQRLEMRLFIPAGLAFNAGAYALVIAHPRAAAALGWVQFVLTLVFVANLVRGFDRRQRLITACAES